MHYKLSFLLSDVSGGPTGCRCCLFAWHCRCPGPPYLVQCGPHFTPVTPEAPDQQETPPPPPGELGGPRAPRVLAIRSDQLDRWVCVCRGGWGWGGDGMTVG